ncbi:hypothetical protein [Flaviaesturariibacter amylovorans]|uniref:Uncharacterized protein n=1 Tax=Flaviaesturariibacter amylovorans TaxID=1084520 RepID=A0ABP8HIF7_9BACT
MRPQDIVILLKILILHRETWQFKDLAQQLLLSPAEISESLNRSHLAGLVDETKRRVNRLNMVEFICYGLHYVFPQAPGALVNGIPTAHAHPHFETRIRAELKYVWPAPESKARGLAIEPLYPSLPKAAAQDEELYLLLACIDMVRVGRQREVNMATDLIQKKILNEPSK